MTSNLLPYSVPSGTSQPFPNESFTIIANEVDKHTIINSSNINVTNDINVAGSINGLMHLKTIIAYTPTEFNYQSGLNAKKCFFLMMEPGKSESETSLRVPFPYKAFMEQAVISNYTNGRTTTLTSLSEESTTTEDVDAVPSGPGFDVGYGGQAVITGTTDTEPVCENYPSSSQAAFFCVSADSINAIAAASSQSHRKWKTINTLNATLSSQGTIGSPKDQWCQISVCGTDNFTLSSCGLVVALSYYEIPLTPVDTNYVVQPGNPGTGPNSNVPRSQPARSSLFRAAFADT